jgi:FkbM family methyltransferase
MNLIKQLNEVRALAQTSKLQRFLHNPMKYLDAILFREFIYKKKRVPKTVKSMLFFNEPMVVALPAGTDIYLTGGKSHDSEIRLAAFIIQHLQPGDDFLDVGAHYGYFSRLAAHVQKGKGKVIAVEPTSTTCEILRMNAPGNNIEVINKAIADEEKTIRFYTFSNQQSEYNSMNAAQFEHEAWYKEAPPKEIEVSATTIDAIIAEQKNFQPRIIKIDVEGAEFAAIQGAIQFLEKHSPYIVMEFLCAARQNEQHKQAASLLQKIGYQSNAIDTEGQLTVIHNIEDYLVAQQLDSDNIVFLKSS